MRRDILLSVLVVVVSPAAMAAQEAGLNLIPADAFAALVINNPDALKGKGDKLFAEAEINHTGLRPTQLVAMGLQALGINVGFDGKGSTCIMLLRAFNDVGNALEGFVVAVPFTDLNTMASNFGFDRGELPPDKVTTQKRAGFGGALLARGKHLYLGHNKTLSSLDGRKSINRILSAAQINCLSGADLLIHLGTSSWDKDWKQSLKTAQDQFGRREDPAEQKIVDRAFDALADMRFGIGAIRVDRGIGMSFLPVFDRDKKSTRIFADLGGHNGGSSLRGLPEGNAIFAQAMRGGTAGTPVVAKVLFDMLLQHVLETRQVISALDRPVAVGLLTEILSRVDASRTAVYLTADESRHGLVSLLAILDTEDAGKFLAEMKVLARIADGTGLKLNDSTDAADGIDIPQLIKDLGDRRFRVRESAMLKLRLLGEPILPHLTRAAPFADLEVARRAKQLREQISEAAALRRKGLLEQQWWRRIQPGFAWIQKAERRGTHSIDVVRIKLTEKDKTAAKPLQQFLGPDWHNLRLATHGNKVVVLLGSETALLDAALKNLDEGLPGLAAAPALTKFQRHGNPRRQIEFHLSMEKLLALVTADNNWKGAIASLTSLAVSLDPEHVQLDIWVPASDFKVLNKRFPF